MENTIIEQAARKKLEDGYKEAEVLLNSPSKMDLFLKELENKFSEIPKVGNSLKNIPIFISLVKSYIKKEYTQIPIGSIIAVTSSLIYFLSPIDLIPDFIPGIGVIDDGVVILCCLKLIETDIANYIIWRDERDGIIVIEKP